MAREYPVTHTGYQRAQVDRFTDRIVCYPVSTGRRGAGKSVSPAIVLPVDAAVGKILKALRLSLQRSNDRWPPPKGQDERSAPLLRAMGVKKWSSYDPIALVSISREIKTGIIELSPLQRDGMGHGNINKRDQKLPKTISDEDLGKKLLKALAKSEAAYRPGRHRR